VARIGVLLSAVLALVVGCDNRPRPVRRPPPQPANPTPIQPSLPGGMNPSPAEPVAFRGEGYFTNADLAGVGLESDPRLKGQDVVYDRYGAYHRYRFKGDLEVLVLPCSSAGAASDRCEEERKGEVSKGNAGISLGKVIEFDVKPEPIAGSGSWAAWIVRSEGRLIVKIGFAQGPFYVSVLWDEGGGKGALEETKPKAVKAAKYIAGRLGR
jgi:hypothetical protein